MNASDLLSALLERALPLTIQSTFLLWFAFGGAFLLRKRGAAAQSLVYRAALVGMVVLAVLSVAGLWKYSGLSRFPAPPLDAPIVLPREEPVAELPATETAPTMQVLPTVTRTDLFTVGTLGTWAMTAWGGVAILILLWTFGCYATLRRLRRDCLPVEDIETNVLLADLCAQMQVRRPLLLTGAWVQAPFLDGLKQPAILLPRTYWTDFTDEALRAVLAHELAHLRRADCQWNLFSRVVCAVGWMHPLLWLLRRRMEHAAEEACDQEVLRAGCSAREYALCLTDLAERMLPPTPARVLGAAVVPFRSGLGRRVKRLFVLAGTRPATLGSIGKACVGLGAVAAVAMAFRTASAMPNLPTGEPMPITNPATLIGKVVHEDGRPAAGIKVIAVRTPPEVPNRSSVLGLSVTKADGSYRMQGLDSGECIIQLLKFSPEWAAAAVTATLRKDETTAAPDIKLVTGALIRGQVVDDTGKPLGGVAVKVDGPDHPKLPENIYIAQQKTDSEGRFQLRVNPGKHTFWTIGPVDWKQVRGRKQPPARKVTVEVATGQSVDLIIPTDANLYASARLIGRVVYPDGRPAQGIRVMAQLNEAYYRNGFMPAGHENSGTFSWAEDISGADGSYQLDGLMSAPYNVSVEDPSRQWIAPAAEGVKAELRRSASIPDLVLTHGALVVGTVTDEATGKPLAGVPIGSYGPHRPKSSAMIIRAETDANGRYQLRVAPGASYFYVQDERYGKGLNADVTLREGDTRELPFRVKAAPPLPE